MPNLVNPYRFSAAGFSPADISGLQLWLDASDASTITETSGLVSQWDDKSGNGNNVTQAIGSKQPQTGIDTLNSKNVLTFLLDSMVIPNVTARTMFFVVDNANGGEIPQVCSLVGTDIAATGDQQYIFIRTNASDYTISLDGTNSAGADSGTVYLDTGQSGSGENIDLGIGTTKKASPCIWAIVGDQNYVDIQRLGEIAAADTDYTSNINFAEVVLYSGVLTATQINQVSNYLSAQWGIAWTEI